MLLVSGCSKKLDNELMELTTSPKRVLDDGKALLDSMIGDWCNEYAADSSLVIQEDATFLSQTNEIPIHEGTLVYATGQADWGVAGLVDMPRFELYGLDREPLHLAVIIEETGDGQHLVLLDGGGATLFKRAHTGAPNVKRLDKDYGQTDSEFLGDWVMLGQGASTLKIEQADPQVGGYAISMYFLYLTNINGYANQSQDGLYINQADSENIVLGNEQFSINGKLEKTDEGIRFTVTNSDDPYIENESVYEFVKADRRLKLVDSLLDGLWQDVLSDSVLQLYYDRGEFTFQEGVTGDIYEGEIRFPSDEDDFSYTLITNDGYALAHLWFYTQQQSDDIFLDIIIQWANHQQHSRFIKAD